MATVQRTKVPTTATTLAKTNGGGARTAPSPDATSPAAAPAQDPVALRAYQIWQESGCPHGKDKEHWYRAERELRAKATRS